MQASIYKLNLYSLWTCISEGRRVPLVAYIVFRSVIIERARAIFNDAPHAVFAMILVPLLNLYIKVIKGSGSLEAAGKLCKCYDIVQAEQEFEFHVRMEQLDTKSIILRLAMHHKI